DTRVVPGPLPQVGVLVEPLPGLAAVVGAKHAAVLGLDDRPDAVGVHRRDGNADDADGRLGQAGLARDLLPGVAAVGTFPQARAGAAALQAVGRAFDAPGRSVKHARVGGVEDQVNRADLVIDEKDTLPRLAAVLAAEDAALLVWPVQVPQG